MLQSINDRIQGWLGWVIVAFISVPFALFGIQSYLEVDGNKFVATVNDTEITPIAFDRALSQQRARLQQMFGKNMPQSEAYDKILKQQVLNQLITTEALNQYANETGYTISNASLSSAIQSIDAFKEDGVFSQDLYEKVINSQGMSLAGFEAMYRQELSTSHIQNTIMSSAISTSSEISQQQALNNQHRNISYIEFDASKYIAKSDVTDGEAKASFEQNSFRYMNPEQVSVQYLELKSEQLQNEVPISEADIKKSYDAYVENAKTNEQRKASHILVTLASDGSDAEKKLAKEKIEKVENELSAGADFAALAKQYSNDEGSAANGGDLGLVSKGMMVKAFEETLFDLNKGQVSEVVRTEFGYHIIKLNEIQAAKIESFETKKSSIEKELKETGVQNLFYERAELLANLAYENPESLDLVAEQLKLKIQKTALFTRTNGVGVAANAKVRNSAFEDAILKDKLNSNAIEITNKHVVVIRVEDHKPATAKDFELVKSNIVAELKIKQAKQKAQDAAAELVEKVQTDSTVSNWTALMSQLNSSAKSLNLIKRDSDKADSQLVKAAFKLSKPQAGKVSFKQVAMSNGNAAVVVVTTVKDMDAGNKQSLTEAGKKLNNDTANKEFAAVVAAIKSTFEIHIPLKKDN